MTVDYATMTWRERTSHLPMGRTIVECGYELAGFGIHRDSHVLDQSNYGVAMRRLMEVAGLTWDQVGTFDSFTDREQDDPIYVGSWGHWAVGWVEELLIRSDRPDLREAADEMLARIEDYPILNEEDLSEREWAENHPDGTNECYSDDPDCGCGRKEDDDEG